jgi:hypothetical protein
LTSYYLLKAFPKLDVFLYGERALTGEELARADVVLMPLFEMEKMPMKSADVTFSSHAISDVSRETRRAVTMAYCRKTKKRIRFCRVYL